MLHSCILNHLHYFFVLVFLVPYIWLQVVGAIATYDLETFFLIIRTLRPNIEQVVSGTICDHHCTPERSHFGLVQARLARLHLFGSPTLGKFETVKTVLMTDKDR